MRLRNIDETGNERRIKHKKINRTDLLLFLSAITFISLVSIPVYAESIISDDFNDNTINPLLWKSFIIGYGPTIAETNQRLEINIASYSADDPSLGAFFAGYSSVCNIRGDFDIQVDYNLLTWPYANGVRVGLGAIRNNVGNPPPDTFGTVERTSFGYSNDFPGYPREVYLTDFSDGWIVTETTDQSGKLRLMRSGNILTQGFPRHNLGYNPI